MSSFITTNDPQQTTLKVGTFNIANSVYDEKSEITNFFKRETQVIDTINKLNCDILCLNELRPYLDRKTHEPQQPSSFLGKLSEYGHVYEYTTSNSLSFATGILYKRSSVYPVKTVKYWLSETPEIPSDSWGNGWGRAIFGCKFLVVTNEKINLAVKPFWVYVVHLGLSEKEKTESAKLIPDIIKRDVKEGEHYAVMGDFNFFDDKDGHTQRKSLSKTMQDVGSETYFSFDKTKRCYGTFLGFEGDLYASDYKILAGLDNTKIPSRLDHIWLSSQIKATDVQCYATNLNQLISRTTPSDHLPLTCTISY